jgi:hypothetical protein
MALGLIAVLRGNAMNDRQWEMSAYAALAFVFVVAIVATAMLVDQLV